MATLVLAASLATVNAAAEPDNALSASLPRWVFVWDADFPGCPTEAQVRTQLLGLGDAASISDNRVSAIALVRPAADKWELRFWSITPGEVRERRLELERCEQAAEAAALLVAMTLNPLNSTASEKSDPGLARRIESAPSVISELTAEAASALGRAQETSAIPPLTATTQAQSGAAAARDASKSGNARARRSFIFSEAGVSFGDSVEPVLLLRTGLGLELNWGALQLLVGGAPYWVYHRINDESSVAVISGNVSLRACRVISRGPWSLPLCVGAEGTLMRASGVRLQSAETRTTGWAGTSATLALRLQVLRVFRVGATLEAAVPWWRPHVDVGGYGTVFQPDRVARRALAMLEVQLP